MNASSSTHASPVSPASRLFTPEGKPVRVLSTSLGIALLANAIFMPGAAYSADSTNSSADAPKLVSWSTEEVKAYFDQNVDWNIPLPASIEGGDAAQPSGSAEPSESPEPGAAGSGGTTIVNNYGSAGSGFGWDDLLLYHLLFNSGGGYSSSGWYNDHRGYYTGTSTPYKPRSYSSGSFQNKSTVGSVVKPKTSTTTSGSITRRSTSASPGGIGGKSSGLSSGSSSSSSKSSSTGSITRSGSSSSGTKSSGGFFGG
nr:hypothetical protein [Paenibacillus physcomitrellae]